MYVYVCMYIHIYIIQNTYLLIRIAKHLCNYRVQRFVYPVQKLDLGQLPT